MASNQFGGIDMKLAGNGGKSAVVGRKDAPRPGAGKSLDKHSASNSTSQRGEAKAPSSDAMNNCR
jgi:hypothetical protein